MSYVDFDTANIRKRALKSNIQKNHCKRFKNVNI